MRKLRVSKRMKRRFARFFLPLIAGLLILTCVAFTVNAEQYRNMFLQGTTINGYDASDLTVEEVENFLRDEVAAYELNLTFRGGETETVSAADIGMRFESDGSVLELLDSQNRFAWVSGILGAENACAVAPHVVFDEAALENYLNKLPELQAANVTAPEDAHLTLNESFRLEIVPEVTGNRLDREKLDEAVRGALESLTPELDLEEAEAYASPSVYADDENLTANMEDINRFLDTSVTYNLSDGSQSALDASRTSAWLTKNGDGLYEISDDVLAQQSADFISELAAADDTYGPFRTFASTNFGNVHMDSDEYHGHALDQEAMTKQLISNLTNRMSGTYGLPYSEYVDQLDPRFGGTYIEIDIENQQVYYYVNYELDYQTGCVTGLEGYRDTPSGIFDIEAKYYDTVLETYQVHVNYFLKVYGGIGLHDASWRSGGEFGSGTYMYDGSHGCINLPYDAARYFYNNVDEGTPVIIFRG